MRLMGKVFQYVFKSSYFYFNFCYKVSEIKKLAALPDKYDVFKNKILPRHPPIMHKWFLEQFPEPTEWFRNRLAYSVTTACMSMVGYIVGLGDRHGENILIDQVNGDCVHVDLNCLFERGLSFDIPEVYFIFYFIVNVFFRLFRLD